MAHDYEDIHNIDSLDDRELRDLVREQLAQLGTVDIDDITVRAADGVVTLSGRVGTEVERRIADHVLSDVLGIVNYQNDLAIDPLRRGQNSDDVEENLAEEEATSGALLGDEPGDTTVSAEHRLEDADDDLTGTTNYRRVMEDGMTWNPPDSPTPEGLAGSDATPVDRGVQH